MNEEQQKVELIIQALQERIGQIVSNYETQIAILRAELTQSTNKANNDQPVQEETN